MYPGTNRVNEIEDSLVYRVVSDTPEIVYRVTGYRVKSLIG